MQQPTKLSWNLHRKQLFSGIQHLAVVIFLYFVSCRMSSCVASSFTHPAGRFLENHVVSVSGRVQRKLASSFLRQELTARSEGWRSLVIFVLLSPVRQRATHQGKSCFCEKKQLYGPLFLQNVIVSWFLKVGNCLIKAVKKANVNKWKSSVREVAAVLLNFLEIPSDYIQERGKTFQSAQLHYLPIAGDINTPPHALYIT